MTMFWLLFLSPLQAAPTDVQALAKQQIHHLIEPVITRFCKSHCQILQIKVATDKESSTEAWPGFEDLFNQEAPMVVPTSGEVTLFIDAKLDVKDRTALSTLVQQHLDTLDFPVSLQTRAAQYPNVLEDRQKEPELRNRLLERFQGALHAVIQQYCPKSCLLSDVQLEIEPVLEAKSGKSFLQDGSVFLEIKKLQATLLVDERMPEATRAVILEMAKIRTDFASPVLLSMRAMPFPDPWTPTSTQSPAPIPPVLPTPTITVTASPTPVDDYAHLMKQIVQTRQIASILEGGKPSPSPTATLVQATLPPGMTLEDFRREQALQGQKLEHSLQKNVQDQLEASLQKQLDDDYKRLVFFTLLFGISLLVLLCTIFFSGYSKGHERRAAEPVSEKPLFSESTTPPLLNQDLKPKIFSQRYEIERLREELLQIFIQSPKVTKLVFTRMLTEQGIEVCSKYLSVFGETIFLEMLRDPSIQSELTQLYEFYAKVEFKLTPEETLELLTKLEKQTVAAKLQTIGNQPRDWFQFLVEMDAHQVLDLIRGEKFLHQAVVLTQCDPQKRASIYGLLSSQDRIKVLTELTQIEYLPKEFIKGIADHLKRQIEKNPKLDTANLPGSEVLVGLLEKTGRSMQSQIIAQLERSNPDGARTLKSKLISLETLRFLRDQQLSDVLQTLPFRELLQFFKFLSPELMEGILSKLPKSMQSDIQDELEQTPAPSREVFAMMERRILGKIKILVSNGLINLMETNERMFQQTPPPTPEGTST
jgi:flagellar motor switch protein FliG